MIYTIDPELLAKPYAAEIAALKPVIAQLVNRYGLAGKSVLSIGAGIGLEEMAMLQCGVGKMTIIDNDESGTLKDFLPTIARCDGSVDFILDDLRDDTTLPDVDAIYVSSFTPDEAMRTETILSQPRRFLRRRWPETTATVHPSILSATKGLRNGGHLIIQSYYGGIPATHRSYIAAWRMTMNQIGLNLSEAYCFKKRETVNLWIAAKGSPDINHSVPLQAFHGRSLLSKFGVRRVV